VFERATHSEDMHLQPRGAVASTSSASTARADIHSPVPTRRSWRAALAPSRESLLGFRFSSAAARGRRCSHVAWYKRNEWIKYMPDKSNTHDYDDPNVFAQVGTRLSSSGPTIHAVPPPPTPPYLQPSDGQPGMVAPASQPFVPPLTPSSPTPQLEELVTDILLRFPEGVNRRKLLRILDQQGHYFGGLDGQSRAFHLVHRMQDGDLAWCVACSPAPCTSPPLALPSIRRSWPRLRRGWGHAGRCWQVGGARAQRRYHLPHRLGVPQGAGTTCES
jgi:hypothetical protein